MPIINTQDGTVHYQLGAMTDGPPGSLATNRQKKLLSFFGISFHANISIGAAGWEIGALMADEQCRERWRRYLYLTNDFDTDSHLLRPFDSATLMTVEIPEDWSSTDALQQFREELAADILNDESPFDRPQPLVTFKDRAFMFTGKFRFGTRKQCQEAVILRSATAPDQKSVTRQIDYLVIGTEGSKAWKKGSYGNKIEDAILARREHGSPAVISEEHWQLALGNP